MATIKDLTKKIIDFRNTRDWKQFHNPKDLSLSLVLEASEVMEHFQWKSPKEIEKYIIDAKEEIGDELADVLSYLLTLSHDLDIDLESAFKNKLKKSDLKYPIEKSKGKHTKYNKL